jgi:hypothetical protein
MSNQTRTGPLLKGMGKPSYNGKKTPLAEHAQGQHWQGHHMSETGMENKPGVEEEANGELVYRTKPLNIANSEAHILPLLDV